MHDGTNQVDLTAEEPYSCCGESHVALSCLQNLKVGRKLGKAPTPQLFSKPLDNALLIFPMSVSHMVGGGNTSL